VNEDEMTPEEMCEALDDADPTALRAALIAVLREDDGAEFRELLARIGERSDPHSRGLYERLIAIPELHDLIPH
jgi:hypothetical protein